MAHSAEQPDAATAGLPRPADWSQELELSLAKKGLRIDPELDQISTLTAQGETAAARASATRLISKRSSDFESRERARYLKATALFLRAQVAETEVHALSDLQQAVALGEPEAPYHLGAHLLLASRSAPPEERAQLLPRIESAMLVGAQLGDSRCMDTLESYYKTTGGKENATYWGILRRMTEADQNGLEAFDEAYREVWTNEDRRDVERAFRAKSPAGGSTAPTDSGVPGRSIITSVYVDSMMRKELSFVWHAFFNPLAPDGTLAEAFENHRRITKENPFARTILLVQSARAAIDGSLGLTHDQLVAAILPGDVVVVQSDGRSHYATVWKLDREAGRVFLLDPFYQFWQPSHNSAIAGMKRIPYLPGRELIQLSWTDVQQILVAAITVRDKTLPATRAKRR